MWIPPRPSFSDPEEEVLSYPSFTLETSDGLLGLHLVARVGGA